MAVKTTVGALRTLIKELMESDWSTYTRNVMSPDSNDREGIEKMTLKGDDGQDELSSHLLDAEKVETDEDVWGPVPPRKDGSLAFHAETDPYSQDWHVLPTPPFSGGR